MDRRMAKASVEVRSGTARFRVCVQALSIRSALASVGARYPQGKVRVLFPIAPEGFFVDGPAAQAGMVETGHRQKLVA
jgi:hypothetical protein